MVATFHPGSALLIQHGDVQSIFAMAALMVAIQDLMQSTNSGNVLFIQS